jgi:hypothetical protein
MRDRIAFALIALCTFAMASAGEPDWLQEARAREAKVLPLKKIKSSDGFFQARVPAKVAGKIVPDDEMYIARLEAGAGPPVECVVLRASQDLANFLAATSNAMYRSIEAARGGRVVAKAIDRVDAGAIGPNPFLTVEWSYRIEAENQEPLVGGLKQIAASKDDHTIYCVHEHIGYVQTFERVARALIESAVFKDAPRARPYRSEIATMSLGGKRVGVTQVTLTRDSEGDTRIQHINAMLLPVDSETLMASDEVMIEWARPDGSLINAFQMESVNGEVESQLNLDPREDGSWAVHGTFQSEPLDVTLPASVLSTMLGDTILLRAKLAAPKPTGGELRIQSWLPTMDPTRFLEQRLAILDPLGGDRFTARLEMVGTVTHLVVERDGSTVSGTLNMGPMKLEIERIFASGSI